MHRPALAEIKKRPADDLLIPVYREVIADMETPVSAFLKVKRGGGAFLLESVEGGQHVARYSFIGIEPYKVIKTFAKDDLDPLPLVAKEIAARRVAPEPGLPRFSGGAVGYFAYEAVTRFEKLPSPEKDGLNLPEAMFMFVDTMLVFDHVTHKIKIVSLLKPAADIEAEYAKTIARIDDIVSRLRQPLPPEPSEAPETTPTGGMTSNFTPEGFMAQVRRIKEYITRGDVIQVVLSQRLSRPTTAPPFAIYRALRTINPSPYMFYLDFDDFQIIGASPEVLVRLEEDEVMTRPLAGTRPRGQSVAEDMALERELRADEKECAEHIMLVDLGRNDIGRVSQPGSVAVSELMEVERYSHVMHLVTHVQGKIRPGLDAFDAFKACFPAGTVSGAPKIRAMEIIAACEPEKRGPYAGAVGYFSFSGNTDMAIALRTMVYKDKVAYIQAGCGIVYDSVPEREYEETLNKARALIKATEQAEGGNG